MPASKGPAADDPRRIVLLVGTRKGAFILTSDTARGRWRLDGPQMFGSIVNHLVLDPRDGRTLLMAAKTGHLGPTIFRSSDMGTTWTEASRPPAFPKVGEDDADAPAVDHTFWLTPGHASHPGRWYAGATPHGMFRSDDGGASWDLVEGFSSYLRSLPKAEERIGGSPAGRLTHSILIDPRDPSHFYVSLSTGGTFETHDEGKRWAPLNKGVVADFLPDKDPEYGQDPHCMAYHPANPDRLYQQNHCGIYRIDRPSDTWIRIGDNMPKDIGDIGFPMVLHPRDPDRVWVFPMDGTTVWPRTSPGGKPAAYTTSDGGLTWTRQDAGLPAEQGWFTVYRQAFQSDSLDPVGLYFGTTSGEIWMSADEGARWTCIGSHLPQILAVTTAVLAP